MQRNEILHTNFNANRLWPQWDIYIFFRFVFVFVFVFEPEMQLSLSLARAPLNGEFIFCIYVQKKEKEGVLKIVLKYMKYKPL